MGFSFAMTEIYHSFDHVMLGFLKGEEVVGWYSAAYRLMPIAALIPGLISYSIYPLLAGYFKGNRKNLDKIVDGYLRVMFIFAIPLGVGGTLLAKNIIEFLYGSGYENSIIALKILSWDMTVSLLSFTYGHPLLAWDQQDRHIKVVGLGAFVNLLFNFLLIPKYGLVGAALATIIAEATVLVGFYRIFCEIEPAGIIKHSFKPMISSAGMAGFLLGAKILTDNLLDLLAVSILSYLLFIILLRGFPFQIWKTFFRQKDLRY